MVATDIGARGLDVENISHVINYDIPDTADAYINRIGRTGRAERTGDAFTFVSPEDNAMVRTLEQIMGQALSRQILEDFDYSVPMPPRQALAHTDTNRTPASPGDRFMRRKHLSSADGYSRSTNRSKVVSGEKALRRKP